MAPSLVDRVCQMRTKKGATAATPATPKLSAIDKDDDVCGARGYCYRDPMHTHICTIVEGDIDDAHDFHICYCGDWWHDR